VEIGVAVEVVRGRGEQVGHLAAVLQRAVTDIVVAAAVIAVVAAVGVDDRALVVRGQRLALCLARIEVVLVHVHPYPSLAGVIPRWSNRAVESRIGIAALEIPQRMGVDEFQAEYRVELAFRESAADLQPLRLLPTMLVAADAVIEGGAVGLLLEDDVDDTGNGIGTVNRRGAAG